MLCKENWPALRAQRRPGFCTAVFFLLAAAAQAQELEPRAYSISPRGTNFAVVGFARSAGGVSFDPTLPVDDASATLHATVIGVGRAISVAGRSANIAMHSSYVWGPFQGV